MALIDVMPRANQEISSLTDADFERVRTVINVLRDYPRAAQTAGIRGIPEVRRAVAGKYLVFHFYEENTDIVYIVSVRHGARKSPTRKDLFPE